MILDKQKITETSLVLTTGFLVLFVIFKNDMFLYFAIAFGTIGLFIKPLAKIVAVAWFKLADILNYFMSKIILGTLFFVVLFPISILYRMMKGNNLNRRNLSKSMWVERSHTYSKNELENIW